MMASLKNHLSAVQTLIDSGASVNAQDQVFYPHQRGQILHAHTLYNSYASILHPCHTYMCMT